MLLFLLNTVDLLFIVAPIVCGLGPCFVLQYLVSGDSWSLCFYFLLCVTWLLLLFDHLDDDVAWPAVFDCRISWSYSILHNEMLTYE